LKQFLFSLILFALLSTAFPTGISITINGSTASVFYFYSVSGEKTALIDSAITATPGKFTYSVPKTGLRTGMYRLIYDKIKRIDFIYDQNEIEISTEANDPIGKMTVLKSEENRLFYEFIRLNKSYKTKSELLILILGRFPQDDKFYKQAGERLAELQDEYRWFVDGHSQKDAASFVARYIKSARLPLLDPALPQQSHLNFLKAHALDNIDFTDTQLTGSDVFANKSIEYLQYYGNPQLPKELLEKEFCKAVDSLFERARINQSVYQHVTEYLISGFREFGFDVVLDYIVENYVIKDDLCLDEKTGGMIKRRIDQARILKIGNTAPDIILPDKSGKEVRLSNIRKAKVLVVFYSTLCPHCKDLLPQLNNLLSGSRYTNVEIVTVSLDSKKDEWISFVGSSCGNLTNLCDLKGWDSNAANDYYIYATPTMFLLDQNLKILAKPMTLKEVEPLLP